MYKPCIAELGEMVDGQVQLAVMPPLAGRFEPIGRVVVDSREVEPRDVLWAFAAREEQRFAFVDQAFSRGALGVVLNGRRMEPWAGKFCVTVPDLAAALHRLMRCLRREDGTWPSDAFGQDEHTRWVLNAVWSNDAAALEAAVESLASRIASVA